MESNIERTRSCLALPSGRGESVSKEEAGGFAADSSLTARITCHSRCEPDTKTCWQARASRWKLNRGSVQTSTTLDRTLTAGDVARIGTEDAYRLLRFAAGEPRLVRDELSLGDRSRRSRIRSLLVLAQITDLQLADAASPGRFEFFDYLRGRPGVRAFVPAQRPQELLTVHAVHATAAAIRSFGGSPETGAPIDLVLSTGDNVDNAQLNELTWYLTLLGGGRLGVSNGGPVHEGVQSPSWVDDLYWHPDPGRDRYKEKWGFPEHVGLLDEAMAPFAVTGVGVPWLSCFGNHDGLVFGEAVATPEYRRILAGSQKAFGLPPGLDPLGREAELFSHPERFLAGPKRSVRPDALRRIVSRRDFVSAHLSAAGAPSGH